MIPVKTIKIDNNLSLRQIIPMDAEDIFHIIDSERTFLGQWLPFVASTQSADDTLSFINHYNQVSDENDAGIFTIRIDGSCVGIIGFKGTDIENHKTEIGYWLSERNQGQGIITRSLKELCRIAFEDLDINRIQIKCAEENDRSKAIPKRLGFTFEGIERDGERMSNDNYVNLEIYSLLKSDTLE